MTYTPSLQQQAMALELREYREGIPMTLGDVAKNAGFSVSKLSRVESATHELSLADLNKLLKVLGIDRDTQQRLRRLRSIYVDRKEEWWRRYNWVPESFAQLLRAELHAQRLRSSHGVAIHGLLETPAYAEHLFIADGDDPDSLQETVELRLQRAKAVFDRPNPARTQFIFGESVLGFGDPEVLGPQLEHLIKMAERPYIDMRFVLARTAITVYPMDLMEFSFERKIALEDRPWASEIIGMGDITSLQRIEKRLNKYVSNSVGNEEAIQLIKEKLGALS